MRGHAAQNFIKRKTIKINLFYHEIFKRSNNQRNKMYITKDINFTRHILIDHSHKIISYDITQQQEEPVKINERTRALDKLESFLDEGKPEKFDLSDLDDQEKDEFLSMLYELLVCGIVECETVEVNGMQEKRYLINSLNDECFTV